MKVVDIAQEIYFDLGEPSDLSIAAISYWVRANVGYLNSLLYSNFVISSDYEITDADNNSAEIDINAVAILKKLYMVYRYSVVIRSKLSVTDSDPVVEVQEGEFKVRKVDRGQLIRTVSAEKKQEEEELKFLIGAYRARRLDPKQVVGDDIVAGSFPEFYPYLRSGRTYGYTAF
jgi:hypothetical protein